MRTQAHLPFHTVPSSVGKPPLLLSWCFTSTETIWFIRDRGGGEVVGGGAVGGRGVIGNENPGPPPFPHRSWALRVWRFFHGALRPQKP